jgi:hypothetical protein
MGIGGGTTGVGATALPGGAATTRGRDGNSESNPRPSARRFSAGLCSSIAAINFSFSLYIVLRYIFIPNSNYYSERRRFGLSQMNLKSRNLLFIPSNSS